MSIRKLADTNIGFDEVCDQRDEDPTQHLVLVLGELLDRLSRRIPGGPTAVLKDIERWEGGDYLYVETDLTSSALPEIDVNIQGGRAFIRMAR